MDSMTFLSTLLTSIVLTIAAIPLFSAMAVRLRIVDMPNERKVHVAPIPRCGGLAMALGAFLPILYWQAGDPFIRSFLVAAGVIVVFGVLDDARDLPPRAKLAGQVAAAAIVVLLGDVHISSLGGLAPDDFLLPDWISIPLTIFAIVGVTNAINLSDGLDGLAGGISLLSFCCIGYLAYAEGDAAIGLASLALAGAIFGFLRFNTHPATVFMGDTGSQLLGFSAAVLSLSLTQNGSAVSPLLPLVLLGFPILDTVTVMTIRIMEGRSPFSADKNHFHHHLMALGLRHSEAVLTIYAMQTILVVGGFLLRFHSDYLILGLYVAFCTLFLLVLKAARRREGAIPVLAPLAAAVRTSRENGEAIRWIFRPYVWLLPLFLLTTAAIPRTVPSYVAAGSVFGLALLGLTWKFRPDRLGDALRVVLYLLIPFLVYKCTIKPVLWLPPAALKAYDIAFFIFAAMNVLISKLSKRRDGFKSTPLDFLILFLAAIAPNLPDHNLQAYNLGLVATKIIILYFSCEVLLAELRGKVTIPAAGAAIALVVAIVKGVALFPG